VFLVVTIALFLNFRKGADMSQAYNQAMNNRGFIDRLTEKLPGYRGYIDRDARQETDRVHREFVSKTIFEQKDKVTDAINDFMEEGGDLMILPKFEKITNRIDTVAQKIRSAAYGSAKLFGASAASEEELRRLHEFDMGLVDAADEIAREIDGLGSVLEDKAKLKAKIKVILKTLDRVQDHFGQREKIIITG
jgi:hypothetical protein